MCRCGGTTRWASATIFGGFAARYGRNRRKSPNDTTMRLFVRLSLSANGGLDDEASAPSPSTFHEMRTEGGCTRPLPRFAVEKRFVKIRAHSWLIIIGRTTGHPKKLVAMRPDAATRRDRHRAKMRRVSVWRAGRRGKFKHVESDATKGSDRKERCLVVALTKRRDIKSRRGA